MNNSKQKVPYVTYSIMGICVLFFAGIHLLDQGNTTETAILLGAWYKPFILAGEWWRMITVAFNHCEFLHLLMNLYALSIMGRPLEKRLGTVRFLILFFGSVLGGSMFLLAAGGNTVAVGCSAGLYGLMSAYVYILSASGAIKIPQVRNSLITTLLLNLAMNLIPGVSWTAHLGGAAAGVLLIVLLQHDFPMQDLRMHAAAAMVIMIFFTAFLSYRNRYIRSDMRYLGTDLNILERESEAGFSAHARKVCARLDSLYDMDGELIAYFEEES